jgi:hypothetical protein
MENKKGLAGTFIVLTPTTPGFSGVMSHENFLSLSHISKRRLVEFEPLPT